MTNARVQTRRQERGQRRMEQILDAAAEEIAEVGYSRTTTNAIAARAGISPGSLYQFFRNKEAIAEALTSRYATILAARPSVALQADGSEHLDEVVARVVDDFVDVNLTHPAAHHLLHAADISPTVAAQTRELDELVLSATRLLLASYLPDSTRAQQDRAARVTVQIFKGLLPLVMNSASPERATYVAELKAAIAAYLERVARR